jgi:hypothetical protein
MDNLEIQFNSNIIKKIKSLNFQVDQIGSVLFTLFALYEGRLDLLDEFDDYNKQRRAFILYTELEMRDLVDRDYSAEADSPHFSLSKDGIELVEYIKGEFAITQQQVTSEMVAVAGVTPESLNVDPNDPINWIDEWIDIFPRGVKSGGRLLRGDKNSCMRKMRVFVKEYSFSKDIIMSATKAYIESKKADNFNYTRCAVYFIYRIEGNSIHSKISDLATWCEQEVHESTEPRRNSESNLEFMA